MCKTAKRARNKKYPQLITYAQTGGLARLGKKIANKAIKRVDMKNDGAYSSPSSLKTVRKKP
ncbi:hypothetical protein J3U68_10540, partial [Snodgrassella sp. B3882]|uniref:hypothetical protein n=1 Tax=Snodgrassella sp. B3882 TaxID=2818037 RepID=UPI00226985FD